MICILRLRGCIQISDVTLKWLSKTSPLLRELDLSGCIGITDMGLLTLIESPISTTLRSLWLRDLSNITETGLSWLADKCPKLLLLDLTGCRKIPSYSIKSLCWKFALYTHTDQFRGMAPRHRAEDWLFIEEYGNCWHSAIQIQCMYRARVARRIARQKREEQLILWVATRLQSVYRGRQARKYAIVCRFQFDKETHAAKQIQTAYRRLRASREAQRLRELRYQDQVKQAAIMIQGAWRRKKLRERLLGRHLRRLAHEDKLQRAAVQIQRHWRGRKARIRSQLLFAEKLLRDREAFESARKMQNLFRARAARHEANRKREELKNEQKRRERAAATLQAQIRRRRGLKELKAMRSYVTTVNTAAGRIQRWWRSKKRFLANQILLLAQRKRRENDAAVKLQAAWKRRKGRMEVKLLRLAREMQQQQLEAAALRVQLNWRGRHGRLKAQEAKNSAMEKLLQQLKVQNDAVALVQAHFRGRKGREKYREAQLLKKKRWKEIVRPENGEKFYYVRLLWTKNELVALLPLTRDAFVLVLQNKVTGEVRFRRPQDLLDLLPKPQCENCGT
ncbi:hypothetical protein BBJ28_00020733 [Nothophytophthora sp. Chile5]|nr:hypothetical protein BBJ28_00020733 [Nothophytophthora sp. Chile5]